MPVLPPGKIKGTEADQRAAQVPLNDYGDRRIGRFRALGHPWAYFAHGLEAWGEGSQGYVSGSWFGSCFNCNLVGHSVQAQTYPSLHLWQLKEFYGHYAPPTPRITSKQRVCWNCRKEARGSADPCYRELISFNLSDAHLL